MVDVSAKAETQRVARASNVIRMQPTAADRQRQRGAEGRRARRRPDHRDQTAAAGDLIPLCHPLPITRVAVEFELLPDANAVRCGAGQDGRPHWRRMGADRGPDRPDRLTIYDTYQGRRPRHGDRRGRVLEKPRREVGDWVAGDAPGRAWLEPDEYPLRPASAQGRSRRACKASSAAPRSWLRPQRVPLGSFPRSMSRVSRVASASSSASSAASSSPSAAAHHGQRRRRHEPRLRTGPQVAEDRPGLAAAAGDREVAGEHASSPRRRIGQLDGAAHRPMPSSGRFSAK